MPAEVVTDRAPTYLLVIEELLPVAWHRTDRYANNQLETDPRVPQLVGTQVLSLGGCCRSAG
jgi:transposase-like protein